MAMVETTNDRPQTMCEAGACGHTECREWLWRQQKKATSSKGAATMKPTTTIKLKCEHDNPAYDQTVHEVIVERETDSAWFGKPIVNPACPTLEWPKFAWKEQRQ